MPNKLSTEQQRLVLRLFADGAIYRRLDRDRQSAQSDNLDAFFYQDHDLPYGMAFRKVIDDLATPVSHKEVAMLSVFKVAGLNHRNPFHWRVVLGALCEHNFGKPKTKDATWEKSKAQMITAIDKATKKKPSLRGKRKATQIAEWLHRHDKDYEDYKIPSIKKLIGEATSPRWNLAVRYPEMKNPLLREIRADLERRGIAWTSDVAREQGELLSQVEGALADARKAWLGGLNSEKDEDSPP